MFLRAYFTSETMEPARDLDLYGKKLLVGDLEAVKSDFARRVTEAITRAGGGTVEDAKKAAVQEIYALRWGPTRVPIYNLLLLGTMIIPDNRSDILEVVQWLANQAKIPVNGRDVSGTLAIHHAISTKPGFDPEFAQILYDAGGDVNLRNRYGETGVFEAGKIYEAHRAEVVRQATAAISWYLSHGGNLDVKDNDGISARALLENNRVLHMKTGGTAVAELYQMIEKEDKRRQELGDKCCTFCGMEPKDGLLTCSRCRSAKYCRPPRNCQRGDWPKHKTRCKKP